MLRPSSPPLTRLSEGVAALRGWRRAALAVCAGALSVLSFAPLHLFPVLFLTLPVLVWLIDGSGDAKSAGFAGWWYGFGYFLFNLFWIGEAFLVEADKFAWALPFAVTLLPAGMALFWALATGLAKRFWCTDARRVIVLAITMALTEWVRGHVLTGLPWNVLGYALTYPLPLMQSAALFGVYALSVPVVLIFTLPLVGLANAKAGTGAVSLRRALGIAVLPLALLYGYGTWRLEAQPGETVAGVKIRIVQPSVPQREKWLPEKQRDIFAEHLDLSATAPDGRRDDLAGITHVIWPEAAMPFLPLEHKDALEAIGRLLPDGTTLISGALRRQRAEDGHQLGYNSIMAFDSDGRLIATYDKTHLVPFGEYLPLAPLLNALGLEKLTHGLGAFDSGPEPRPVLTITGLPPAGGLICYEVLFPGAVIDDVHRPDVLINVTNDGWFGDTSGPRQHFYQARVRAVEEGLPLLRAANNGVSAVVDPYGRISALIRLNQKGVIDSPLAKPAPLTPYAWLRDYILAIFIATLMAGLLLRRHSWV
ncbi:MAG: apolipoprotein N-acyltransferase [Hyphomicrobium sp.]